jgi:hypothetical protein
MAHLNPISLNELKDNATNCRVKRHLISTITHEHGQTAETKPDSTIRTQRVKMGYILKDPKLDSKVLLEFLMHMTFDCFRLTLSSQLCGMRACKFFRTMLCRQVGWLKVA